MPRRTAQKCSRRHAGQRLDATDELVLVWGHAFGVADWERPLQSQGDFMRLWGRWGAKLTSRWIELCPGSRPIGCYLAHEIEPPAWRHELKPLRHPVRIGGVVVIEDRAWQGREPELDHLAELGIVAGDELELAAARLASPTAGCHERYRLLSDEA